MKKIILIFICLIGLFIISTVPTPRDTPSPSIRRGINEEFSISLDDK